MCFACQLCVWFCKFHRLKAAWFLQRMASSLHPIPKAGKLEPPLGPCDPLSFWFCSCPAPPRLSSFVCVCVIYFYTSGGVCFWWYHFCGWVQGEPKGSHPFSGGGCSPRRPTQFDFPGPLGVAFEPQALVIYRGMTWRATFWQSQFEWKPSIVVPYSKIWGTSTCFTCVRLTGLFRLRQHKLQCS